MSTRNKQTVKNDSQAPQRVEQAIPGSLNDKVTITLHTKQAYGIMKGRPADGKKPVVIGLFGFAGRTKEIFDAAKNDNPYADWWLIRTEEKIMSCRLVLKVLDELIKDRLGSIAGITIEFDDASPATTELKFLSQYGHLVAHIITLYDTAMRSLISLRKIGQLDDVIETHRRICGRQIRGLLGFSYQYKSMKVSRSDMIDRTDKGIQAEKRLGSLPREILNSEKLPAFGPIHPDEETD